MGVRSLRTREIVRLSLISRWKVKGGISAPAVGVLPENLISFAVERGSLGILLSALTDWGFLSLIDRADYDKAKASLAYTELLNVAMRRELEAVFNRFHEKGVGAVLIKGHDIINRYYGDFRIRPTTDADVLVFKKDMGSTAEILRGAGYRPTSDICGDLPPAQWSRGSFCVDLHTEVIDEGRINTRRYLPALATEEIFASAVKAKIGGADYLSPDPYHTLIISSVHALKHSYLKDYWFLDVGRIIESLGDEFSIDLLLGRADSSGLVKIVGKMLWIVTELFEFPLRSDKIPRFRPGQIERGMISAAIGSRRSLQFGDILLGLNIDNPTQKFYYYRELLFPGRDVLMRELGSGGRGDGQRGGGWARLCLYFSRTIHLLKSFLGIIFYRRG